MRDFWSHRPRRPRNGRKIAGVAAAIANRYQIDALVVRVALVVTAIFGGAGVLLYLLGWLFLPDEQDEVSPFEAMIGRGRSSTSTAFTVLLCLALFPAGSWFLGGAWWFGRGFSGFLGLALLLTALYLLHRNRGHLGAPAPADAPTADASTTTAPTAADVTTTPVTESTTETEQTPPAWGPVDTAPLAGESSEPTPASRPVAPQVPRPRSKVGLVTIGSALVTVAICVALASMTGGWMTPAHVVGIVLGVLGLGMIIGSFAPGWHAGRGLIVPAVVLAIVGVVMTAAHVDGNTFRGGLGNRSYVPTALSDVQPEYYTGAGNLKLDLTRLPSSGEARTSLHATFGNVRVTVPADATVAVHCHSAAGNVDCLGAKDHGRGSDVDRTDGAGTLKINLDVATTAGNVEVSRG